MTTRKDQKPTKLQPEQRDDLALDPETVKDLEPRVTPDGVRGGAGGSSGGFSRIV